MSDTSLFTLIRTKYHTLSTSQKAIADFLLNNGEEAMLLTINDLADTCNTSVATISRFYQKLGIVSYQALRVKLTQEISLKSDQSVYEDIKGEKILEIDSISKIQRKVISSINDSIHDLNDLLSENDIDAAVNFLIHAHKILFFGVGGSAIIAQDAYHKFIRLGISAVTESSEHLMYIHCTHCAASDILFLVSQSGESKSVVGCAKLAKENGARIIVLTGCKTSSLAKYADVVLLSSAKESKFHTDAMIGRIMQLCIIDILYVLSVLRLGNKGIKKINKSRLSVASTKN